MSTPVERSDSEWCPFYAIAMGIIVLACLLVALAVVGVTTYGDVLKHRDTERSSVSSITARFHDRCGADATVGIGPKDWSSMMMYLCADRALVDSRP